MDLLSIYLFDVFICFKRMFDFYLFQMDESEITTKNVYMELRSLTSKHGIGKFRCKVNE